MNYTSSDGISIKGNENDPTYKHFEIELGRKYEKDTETIVKLTVAQGIEKIFQEKEKVQAIKISLGTWKNYDYPYGEYPKVIFEAIYEKK